MIQNPLHKAPAAQSEFRITLVYQPFQYDSKQTQVIAYCKSNHIPFVIREFNSVVYEEDREHICKLPAFHIYKRDDWMTTFYSDTVETVIHAIQEEQKPVEQKPSLFKRFIAILRGR